MTSQIESTKSTQYTPLYRKGLKEEWIKSMETTNAATTQVHDISFFFSKNGLVLLNIECVKASL